jgi:hypothetical protein
MLSTEIRSLVQSGKRWWYQLMEAPTVAKTEGDDSWSFCFQVNIWNSETSIAVAQLSRVYDTEADANTALRDVTDKSVKTLVTSSLNDR